MDTRKSKTRNLVKSLYLNPDELNNHNLKLKEKYDRMRREEVRFEKYNMDSDYSVLIVSYGTMSRVCRTAVDMMKEEGLNVGMLRPRTLFPFPEEAISRASTNPGCAAVFSIEMSMGQMLEDVQRSVAGQKPVHWYGKCGGDVPSPEEIIEVVKSVLQV
jgi:2-oxoglutarate ferredoxin oxidoreductase subunit alpha